METPGADRPDPGPGAHPTDPGPGASPIPATSTFRERHGITPVAFALLCVIFFAVVYQGFGSALSVLLFGLTPDLSEPGDFRIFTGVTQVALLLVPALLVARLASPRPLDFLRVRRPPIGALLVPLAGIFSLQQMLQVYMVFQDRIPLPPEVEGLVNQFKEAIGKTLMSLLGSHSFPEFLGVVLVIAVIPAVAEEFAFRGLIQGNFERGIGPASAVTISGIIFGLFHLNPFSIVPLIALGVYLGFIAYRSNSIWVSIAAHFFNNLIPVTALYLNLADEKMVTGEFGDLPFATLMAIFWFSGVIFLLSTYYFLHLTKLSAVDVRRAEPQ